MANEPIKKVYDASGGVVPDFEPTPTVGVAALEVEFIDRQYEPEGTIVKAYVSGAGEDDIIKGY